MGFVNWVLYDLNFQQDPLAGLTVVPHLDNLAAPYIQFGVLPRHFQELIFFYLLYTLVFKISEYVSPWALGSRWDTLKHKDKIYFHIHVVSMFQCILILGLILPMFNDPVLVKDRVFGYTPYGGFIAAAASGYFLWDFLTAIYYLKYFGVGFAIHGAFSFVVSFLAFNPFIMYYAPIFLFFEVSTPFLNVRWFNLKLPGLVNKYAAVINNVLLICLFFFVRICWGWYQISCLVMDFYSVKDDPRFPVAFGLTIFLSNLALDILNLYWFNLMLKVAVKQVSNMITGAKEWEVDENSFKGNRVNKNK